VSYCRKHGTEFTYEYTEEPSIAVLKRFKPDVVALTSITENYNQAKLYAQIVKRFDTNIRVIIGGAHISAVPNTLSSDMDIGVIGEGEQTFLDLYRNEFEPSSKIDGLVYWEKGTLKMTRDRELIEPLDTIPHPDRSIYPKSLPTQQYLFTSRGCTNRCVFCSSSRFWKKLRLFSSAYVAEEIFAVKQDFGVSHLNILDDTFLSSVKRAREISELVKDAGLTFFVNARANQVTEDTALILKRMNVTQVGIGFESNSEKILTYLQKGNTPADNQNAVNNLRKQGINVFGYFIRDIPGETREDLKATYKFIRKNKISYDMYHLIPLPGTPLYKGSENWDDCKVRVYRPLYWRVRGRLRQVKPLAAAYRRLKTKR